MKGKKRLLKWYIVFLAAFTAFTALDTFVLTKTYEVVETVAAEEVSQESSSGRSSGRGPKDRRTASSGSVSDQSGKSKYELSGAAIVTEDSYTDENISVKISEYEYMDTAVYVAEIELASPEYLKTAFANNSYGKNITAATSETAESVGAILAINGDYYGVQERGYVLRNGILYRSVAAAGREDLVIYGDGSFEIIKENEVSAEELLAKGAVQILSFGPALVEEGEISVSESDEVGRAKASNPRTAVAIREDGSYLFIVSDGRSSESEGLSLYELAVFAKSLGAVTAYNLDGGGSSTMVFNGTLVNNPTSSGTVKERKVSDIVYIGY